MQQKNLFDEVVVKDPLLRDKFIEPPFSVLDTKQRNWQNRKRLWGSKGIKSEVGRDAKAFNMKEWMGEKAQQKMDTSDTSIFDPALCEVLYKWFCEEGGRILDPFAGGSVRGIVANYLGFNYTGIDIRLEQIESNREQAINILPVNRQPQWYVGDSNIVLDEFKTAPISNIILTPVEPMGEGIYLKREDFYNIHGANGAKARSAFSIISRAVESGQYAGITTAGSRQSPQIGIVANICNKLGVPFVAHCPEGELSDELKMAQSLGANVEQHANGYNNVIISRCKEFAEKNNYFYVPFGMEHDAAIDETAAQVQNIPQHVSRIVITVGSGMNLAGVLHGMRRNDIKIPVLAVSVGADATKRLDKYAPEGWREMVTIVKSELDYHTPEKDNVKWGQTFDPIYEAKCLKYIQPGDLFWVIGIRKTLVPGMPENNYCVRKQTTPQQPATVQFDLVFSCPPYADLEVYSKLPGDISNMKYPDFLAAYKSIIKKSCNLLKPGGYAVFVVGEVRGKDGGYIGFVPDTIAAFRECGMLFYNEAILLNAISTAAIRADGNMKSGKLVKVHQNVLVFKKP